MDLSEIMVRYPKPPVKGPAILTASGAFVALSNDFAEDLGLDFPALEPATLEKFSRRCCRPTATTAIRSTSRPGLRRSPWPWRPRRCWTIRTSACCSSPFRSTPAVAVQNFNKGMAGSTKPKVMVALGDTWTARSRCHGGGGAEPGRVLAFVGSHAARHRALYAVRPAARPSARRRRPGAGRGPAQARQGRAARMARQEGARRRRRPRARRRPCPHRRRSGRSGQSASAIRWC